MMDNHAGQSTMKRFMFRLLWTLFVVVVLLTGVWVSFAFWVQLPFSNVIKYFAIGGWWLILCSLFIGLFGYLRSVHLERKYLKKSQSENNVLEKKQLDPSIWLKRFYHGLFVYFIALLVVFVWWQTIEPKQNLAWAEDVSRTLHVEQRGNIVTLHNVRNFDWRTETDFSPRWETRQYDLSQLSTLDVITSYWMGPEIAHVLLSFGFSNGDYLTFSIETRRENTESFSTIGGFFRKFELSLIAADERDIIYTRTNVRGEQVYLYRMDLAPKNVRRLFELYLDEANQLQDNPRFYNSLTSNCTTIVFNMAKIIDPSLPIDYRIVLSGYLPEYINDQKGFKPNIPFKQLKQHAHINPYAQKYAASGSKSSREYSIAIRQGIVK